MGAAAVRGLLPTRQPRPGAFDPRGGPPPAESGAEPNAGYLWGGECLFTALTGAFGGGEEDQPAHQHSLVLARMLLEAGADPNDTQTLYNLGMGGTAHDTTDVLELLLEFGLGAGTGSWWDRSLGDEPAPNDRLLHEELLTAALWGLPRRARLLIDHGVDVDVRSPGSPFFGDYTPYQLAVANGHTEVAVLLALAGAETAVDPSTPAEAPSCPATPTPSTGSWRRTPTSSTGSAKAVPR